MKKFWVIAVIAVIAIILTSCGNQSKTYTAKDKNGYTYEAVKGDPANARIYTLANGLKVYLSVNKDEPRIQTYIAVRAGSKNDPRETTGLAHYFEHMMFKGTDKIGTKDWEKESLLIQQISDKFEERGKLTDKAQKDSLYRIIDSLSLEASKYAVANEYDKICSMLGATGTNAWTSKEETVYVNEIPSNEVERFLQVERERFQNIVLRLFHTELETVYEEYNMGQDRDGRKVSNRVFEELFKNHQYGTSVLGLPEHLKNPSMVNIMKFRDTYYVPNNIAICMSGDLDMEETIKLIDKYWGDMKPNENLPKYEAPKEEPITEIKTFDILGPERENMIMVYRCDGNKSKEVQYLDIISDILNNGTAGLMDLDLIKKQKVMTAYAYVNSMNDYGYFQMGAYPKEGQTLEELKDLLLGEIEKVKKGEFDDWLMEAIVNKAKLNRIEAIENNSVAYWFVNAFIADKTWEESIFDIEANEKVTKQEIVDFANKFFGNNYYVFNKRVGVDTTIVHVDKPEITHFEVDRNAESAFVTGLKKEEPKSIEPVFINFKEKLQINNLNDGVEYNYIKNETNNLFSLYYIFDMGRRNNKLLPIAIDYTEVLGTDTKTIDDLQKEWYKLGVNFYVSSGEDKVYVYVSGLDENLEVGMKLMEEILANVKPNQEVYNEYASDILKNRNEAKKNKNNILSKMMSYSKYGNLSATTDIIPAEDLKNLNPEDLTNLVKDLYTYKHKIFYYGPRDNAAVAEVIKANHKMAETYREYPAITEYAELDYTKPKIYFANYDMVQSMIYMVSKDVIFDPTLRSQSLIFNEYYGGSMASIIFQEIREAKALAYSAYAGYNQAGEKGKSNYIMGYLSTQPDKMKDALDAMTDLLNDMPLAEQSFNTSKESCIKQMNTTRIIKESIYWNYDYYTKLGISTDIDPRQQVYDEVKNSSLETVGNFFNNHVKDKKFDILIVGDKAKIDFNLLKKYGDVKELSLEEVFNY
ncbi:MAG: insulinase family protein [Bacteroidales bacterium]|jgi:predicted Zn-dependent peptidase|nr:insulinase family protein [Bacteroidales bacterium]